MIKIFLKGNLNQRIMSLLIKLSFKSNLGCCRLVKVCPLYCLLFKFFRKEYNGWNRIIFWSNFLKRQYELNRIVFWSKFSYKTVWVEPYCLLVKIVFLSTFSIKTIWVEPYCLLIKIFLKNNMGWTILSFSQNFRKSQYGLNLTDFCSKFSIKAIWFDLYRPLIKIFQKDYMNWTALSCQ